MLQDWQDAAFVLISPDTLVRGLGGPVVEAFSRAGLDVERWVATEIGPAQIDAMHHEAVRRGGGDIYRYRCLDALFDLGPAVALRLVHGRRAGADVSPHLRALDVRGASRPEDLTPGTIRHDLGAVNTIMSLLHVSDTAVDAARECELLLGGAHAWSTGWRPGSELAGFLGCSEPPHPEWRMPGDVAAGIQARATARLWACRPGAGPDPGNGGPGPTAGAEVLLYLRLDAPFDAHVVECAASRHAIRLDPWERTVLRTCQHFSPWKMS
jgi:nucleoside diphosphate kinase